MPDINALLHSLHEDRKRRRSIVEAAAVPALTQSSSASSLACYKVVPLLVLDLDGTLLDSQLPGVRPGAPSFTVDGMYETRLRPGIGDFIVAVRPHFDLAIFTAGNAAYANRMIDGIDAEVPGFRASLRCVFSREQVGISFENGRMQITKDLRSLARHCGRPMCRCLIVDDTPETYRLNPANALPVPVYDGSSCDQALYMLRDFLLSMPRQGVPLDVRGWPLRPRGARPLLAEPEEHGCGRVLGTPSTITHAWEPLKQPKAEAPDFLPAFLPAPEEAAPDATPSTSLPMDVDAMEDEVFEMEVL